MYCLFSISPNSIYKNFFILSGIISPMDELPEELDYLYKEMCARGFLIKTKKRFLIVNCYLFFIKINLLEFIR